MIMTAFAAYFWRRQWRADLGVALLAASVVLGAANPADATKITRVVSPGGIVAWLVQEPSIPMLSVEISFQGGSVYDPPGKEGLANLLSGLLDEGAGDIDSIAFQTRLEDLAISLSFTAGRETFSGSLRTLTKNRDEAFRLLGLALTQPRFDDEPVTRIRGQILAGLLRAAQNANRIASRTFFEAAYPGHPYGHPTRGTEETVTAITADDLRAFVATRLAKDTMLIGAVGDITPDELGRLLDSALGPLPATSVEFAIPEIAFPEENRTIIVRRGNPQSVLMFGMPGIKRDDPGYFAAILLNYVLGGGSFSSRLYSEIREKRGLAYSVYSSVYPLQQSGMIIGGVGTANDRVAESLELVRAEIRDVALNGISEDELARAKTYITGSFPLRLDSNARIANMLVALQIFDLGIDYLERRADIVNSVTLEDVSAMAQRLFKADGMLVVVVGDPVGVEGEEIAAE
jgi:zinc protease